MLNQQQHDYASQMKKQHKLLLYFSLILIIFIIIIFICCLLVFDYKYGKNINQNNLHNITDGIKLLPYIQERENIHNINNDLDNNSGDNKYRMQKYDQLIKSKIFEKDIFSNNDEVHLNYVLNCRNYEFKSDVFLNGNYWILKNYIRAEHGELNCNETITYSTHGDYTVLNNVIPLLRRWQAPISIALYSPGKDFSPTLNSILFLRYCLPESIAVRKLVTFHIYFSIKHIPINIPKSELIDKINCNINAPYLNVNITNLYTYQNKLLYPINVGRNIARNAALTYFILSSDIEFYPSHNLVKQFLRMIKSNEPPLTRNYSRVYTLPLFKTNNMQLLQTIKTKKKLINFMKKNIDKENGNITQYNHRLPEPKINEWLELHLESELRIFHIQKRIGIYKNWNPIYIGTRSEPQYDERLRLEGKNDRNTQSYALCLLNYEFFILNNAFLIAAYNNESVMNQRHNEHRERLEVITNQLITNINNEMVNIYGVRDECDS